VQGQERTAGGLPAKQRFGSCWASTPQWLSASIFATVRDGVLGPSDTCLTFCSLHEEGIVPDPTIDCYAMQVVSGPVLWSPDEDKLLHAIVHEFGSNWSLVCDVLASSTALQGIARNWRQCKDRYKEIQVRGVRQRFLQRTVTVRVGLSIMGTGIAMRTCHRGLACPGLLVTGEPCFAAL